MTFEFEDAVASKVAGAEIADDAYVNALFSVPVDPLVTDTSTVAAPWAPVVAVMSELSTTVTPVVATPPIETVEPPAKPDPAMTTGVPPLVRPTGGLIDMITGVVAVSVELVIVNEMGPVSPV